MASVRQLAGAVESHKAGHRLIGERDEFGVLRDLHTVVVGDEGAVLGEPDQAAGTAVGRQLVEILLPPGIVVGDGDGGLVRGGDLLLFCDQLAS